MTYYIHNILRQIIEMKAYYISQTKISKFFAIKLLKLNNKEVKMKQFFKLFVTNFIQQLLDIHF